LHPKIADYLAGATLVDCLQRCERPPDKPVFYVDSLEHEPIEVLGTEFLDRIERAALSLRSFGLDRKGRVLLVLPTSPDFVFFFWGTLLAAATPVPAYPPAGLHQLAAFTSGLVRKIAMSKAKLVVVPALLRDLLEIDVDGRFAGAQVITPEELWAADVSSLDLPAAPKKDDLALVQFSSGSTGEQRGVCLTHANILANVRAFLTRLQVRPGDRCITWLPMYHDMGLIGTMMGAILAGEPVVLIPPTDFLRKPGFWLQVLGKYRGTISVAPHFAFNLCVRKVQPEDLAGVDLSSLRVILNGAEPIQPEGVTAFQKLYRPLGLKRGVVTPCYGLAEATLAASMAPFGRKLIVSQPGPEQNGREPAAKRGHTKSKTVSVGPPMQSMEVRVVGENGRTARQGTIGEIHIRGESVCTGYLSLRGMKRATDTDGWLATGDLGFFNGGELYVTGRLKDLIIIGGRNVYPQEVEEVAGKIAGFRPGRVAAFGTIEPERATEVLVIVAETAEIARAEASAAVATLRQQLLNRFGVVPHDVVLVKGGQIPRTTSGKLRRGQTREDYERGGFQDAFYRVRSLSQDKRNTTKSRKQVRTASA
jgi:acyl-CoA synthetase (AMP-forming)/AMP-acid ligase II